MVACGDRLGHLPEGKLQRAQRLAVADPLDGGEELEEGAVCGRLEADQPGPEARALPLALQVVQRVERHRLPEARGERHRIRGGHEHLVGELARAHVRGAVLDCDQGAGEVRDHAMAASAGRARRDSCSAASSSHEPSKANS